jgi:hypothetical protein
MIQHFMQGNFFNLDNMFPEDDEEEEEEDEDDEDANEGSMEVIDLLDGAGGEGLAEYEDMPAAMSQLTNVNLSSEEEHQHDAEVGSDEEAPFTSTMAMYSSGISQDDEEEEYEDDSDYSDNEEIQGPLGERAVSWNQSFMRAWKQIRKEMKDEKNKKKGPSSSTSGRSSNSKPTKELAEYPTPMRELVQKYPVNAMKAYYYSDEDGFVESDDDDEGHASELDQNEGDKECEADGKESNEK